MIAFFILLIAPFVAGRDCEQQSPPLPFPSCTEHPFNDEQIGNICIENLSGICARPNGTNEFFDGYGASLLTYCPSDDDRYKLVDMFQSECASVSRTVTNIPGGFSSYLMIDRIGQLQSAFSSSAESTSSQRQSSTRVVTSIVTPSPTFVGDTIAPATVTNTVTTLGSTLLISASPTTTDSDPSITDAAVLPSSTSATSSSTPASEPKATSNNSKTVIAAVCGSVGALALAAGLLLFFLIRRRKRAGPVEIGGQDSPILAGIAISKQGIDKKGRPITENGGASDSPLTASELEARFAKGKSRNVTELDSPEIYEMDGSSIHSMHGRRSNGPWYRHV